MAKYINNDITKGIDHDWGKIKKRYKNLGIPQTVYHAEKLPLNNATYFNLLSERSTGKTTNLLLLGMCAYVEDGTVIVYVRKQDSMISKKELEGLFNTILQYKYIEVLTKNKWNSLFYYAGKFYFCSRDDEGNLIDKDPKYFMRCIALNKRDVYKSSLVEPTGDFILYDEYVSDYYRQNEFIHFCDLLKTVLRDRLGAKIFMLANTINLHSDYFSEMEIADDVAIMESGEHQIITTRLGTKIYVELIKDAKEIKVKKELNTYYFGFKNPLIASITGQGWAFSNYPHIESGYTSVLHGIYIDYHGKLLELEIVEYPDMGLYINVHRASVTYDDSIIYSNDEPKDGRYIYHMGTGRPIDIFINECIINHRIRFQDNSVGTIFFNHCNLKN